MMELNDNIKQNKQVSGKLAMEGCNKMKLVLSLRPP